MNLPWPPHALFIILFLTFGLVTALINYFTVRRFDQYPASEELPHVSVLVPARNEERNIEACVKSLLGQDYPDFEVIVLDDHSTDRTRLILDRLLETHPGLKVQNGAPLPEGWLGKHWACQQLYQASSGDLLLFTDADTRHTPDMLRASVSALLAEGADLVTAFPHEDVVSWGEKLVVPFIGFGILTFIPLRLVQRLRWSALSITIGQFMLFRRMAFEAVGGFEAVRTEIVDDVCLGRNIISGGFEWRLMDGTQHVSCRMYRGFWEAVNGFGKSIFAVFDFRILPYLFAWLLIGLTFLEPILALVSRWLRHPLTPLEPEPASLAVALSLLLWSAAYRRFKFPAYMVLFYPLTMLLFLLVALRSFVQTATGTATWKDRTLERSEMRWL
ncbi:MAG: glycosyltransferase [Chloroflexota bacterium]